MTNLAIKETLQVAGIMVPNIYREDIDIDKILK